MNTTCLIAGTIQQLVGADLYNNVCQKRKCDAIINTSDNFYVQVSCLCTNIYMLLQTEVFVHLTMPVMHVVQCAAA